MSAESDLIARVKNDRIKPIIKAAVEIGWRVDRHKRTNPNTGVYMVWPATRESTMVPTHNWQGFRIAAKYMETVSGCPLLPRPNGRVQVTEPTTNIIATVLAKLDPMDLVNRVNNLQKEHQSLCMEYRILTFTEPERTTQDEIDQARTVLYRLHKIEEALLEMGQPLHDNVPTTQAQ
jgi:hypothetical protein